MAGLTMEELRLVNALNKRLETLHLSAEEKVSNFRKDLEEKFGIVAQLPPSQEEEVLKIDLEHELRKLRKIKELLQSESAVPGGIGIEAGEPEAAEVPPVPPADAV